MRRTIGLSGMAAVFGVFCAAVAAYAIGGTWGAALAALVVLFTVGLLLNRRPTR
jgi:hypothetical protein